MPADLVPHSVIPDLTRRVSADMLAVLRRIQRAEFITNGKDLDKQTAEVLRQLTELGLVDPGYDGDDLDSPYLWVRNGNGSRVLGYMTGIRGGPHYEVPAAELATWLEEQGGERWWNVDGDPLLTGRRTFPCPATQLAAELRLIGRPLLLQARKEDNEAKGQTINAAQIGNAVSRITENVRTEGTPPPWANDRILYLCWKNSLYEWLLEEDGEATGQMQVEERRHTREQARVKKD